MHIIVVDLDFFFHDDFEYREIASLVDSSLYLPFWLMFSFLANQNVKQKWRQRAWKEGEKKKWTTPSVIWSQGAAQVSNLKVS